MKTDDLGYDEDTAFTLADDAATISAIVRRTPDERLRAAKIGDWTAKEVIGHVADLAEVFAERVRRCVTDDRPALASVDRTRCRPNGVTTTSTRWPSRSGSSRHTRRSCVTCSSPAPSTAWVSMPSTGR